MSRIAKWLPVGVLAVVALAAPAYSWAGEDKANATEQTTAEKQNARMKKHAEEMNKGKDHEQARDATPGSEDADKANAKAAKHAEEMNKGKDHAQARDAARESGDAEDINAKAAKHAEEMNKGKDHTAASQAADEAAAKEKESRRAK